MTFINMIESGYVECALSFGEVQNAYRAIFALIDIARGQEDDQSREWALKLIESVVPGSEGIEFLREVLQGDDIVLLSAAGQMFISLHYRGEMPAELHALFIGAMERVYEADIPVDKKDRAIWDLSHEPRRMRE